MLAKEDSLIMSLPAAAPAADHRGLHRPDELHHAPARRDADPGRVQPPVHLFDKYVLDMTADRDHALDRRMAVALGVLLDTGERR